jgi:D-lactate dehydratase
VLSMPSLPRRVIISVTSATAPLHEGHQTGLFIAEAMHPYNVFSAAGFEVDFVSEKGTYAVDWLSEQPDFLPPEDKKQWEDVDGAFRQKLDHMPTPDKVDASQVSVDRYDGPIPSTSFTYCKVRMGDGSFWLPRIDQVP